MGSLEVTVSVSGADLPGVYTLVISSRSQPNNPVNTPVTVPALPPGEHFVRVEVPVNCHVVGDNPRRATIVGGQSTTLTFTVTCSLTTRTLTLITMTAGSDIDANGYAVRIEGSTVGGSLYERNVQLAPTDEITVFHVPSNAVRVTLLGLALNCNAAGANPRTLAQGSTEPVVISYEVSCAPATAELAYVFNYVFMDQKRREIRIAKLDGTSRVLTTGAHSDSDPAWSPDGNRVAFSSDRDGNREIYVIDADGTNAVRLTDHPNDDVNPAWSPDGQRIAFVNSRFGTEDIFVMNADGTGLVRLTSDDDARDLHPAWSRDGRTIAFTRERNNVTEIYTMDASGAGQTRFTIEQGRHPAWSPDGTRLAFGHMNCGFYSCSPGILIKVGSLPATSVGFLAADRPAWSPDGRRIAVDRYTCDFYYSECTQDDIYILTVDGTDQVRLVSGHSAVWRPNHD